MITLITKVTVVMIVMIRRRRITVTIITVTEILSHITTIPGTSVIVKKQTGLNKRESSPWCHA